MQTAVLGVCCDSVKDVVRARLLHACGNNCGSGLAGGGEEARNFHAVRRVLRSVGKRVRVLDVECMADFWDGLWLGVWFLGAARGALAGTLVWSRFDQHVFVANCEGMQEWLDPGDSCGAVGRAPWIACNV